MAIENPTREEIGKILKTNKRIAVVGLSNNPGRTSFMISQAMMDAGYEIIPVNPTIDEALGIKAVDSLKDIKGHVDIVNVFRRSEFLPDIMKETVEIGADVFWAQLGVMNEEAYEYGKKHNMKMIMDRCIKVEHAMTK
ncbi:MULTISPECIES: CoA-binding protein [Bacillales]|uniref:CoA-binding protein n=1 Tax=Bacillales TaxID=1385 RepID=UPI0018845B47|nr:CoA-binding protein [Pseudalkalibacillus hwajinpoensis]MBF0708847.1 CoA-binding protein [Pseudalkalibacillus hwajinpoensis]WLR60110.1 CoA-binding protein [Pseudalkalibacillus hwajinpoensis]